MLTMCINIYGGKIHPCIVLMLPPSYWPPHIRHDPWPPPHGGPPPPPPPLLTIKGVDEHVAGQLQVLGTIDSLADMLPEELARSIRAAVDADMQPIGKLLGSDVSITRVEQNA